MYVGYMKSPLGIIRISADCDSLLALDFLEKPDLDSFESNKIVSDTLLQLDEYFSGRRKEFNLPIDFGKLSKSQFEQKVWSELCNIPYGSLCSYKDVAEKIKMPKAYRAVGNANGKNPIPLIIPCHRVISANGTMGGYSLDMNIKKFLISLESGSL